MRNIDSDLIRGNIDTIILKTMLDGDKYGLDIIKEVELRSNGTYELKQPTLYSCLKRLENQELISSYWLDSDIGGRRHYYKLTDKGRAEYEKKQEEWSKSKFIIDNLLSNYDYDDYRLVKKDDYDRIIEGKTFTYNKSEESANESDLTQNFDESDDDDVSQEENETFSSGMEISEPEENEDVDDVNSPALEEETDDMEDYKDLESSLHQEEFDINDEESSDNEDDDERIYVSDYEGQSQSEIENESENNGSYFEEKTDQSNFENNILASLRKQDDEEVYTYVGDQKSYINHLNMADENEENEDFDVVQQNLLDDPKLNGNDELEERIDEFSQNIDELNKFLAMKNADNNENLENDDEFSDNADEEVLDEENEEDNQLFEENSQVLENEISENSYEENEDSEPYEDNYLDELNDLNSNGGGYFSSNDSAEYENFAFPSNEQESEIEKEEFEPATQKEEIDEENEEESDINENFPTIYSNENEDNEDFVDEDENQSSYEETSTFADYSHFDNIISENVNNYTDTVQSTMFNDNDFPTFTPKYTSQNYKEKLSNLSEYSKTSIDNSDKKDCVKDTKSLQALKNDFEKEGIEIKEFTKYYKSEEAEKSYLLINKINLVNSLILLFGFVFLLSAVFVILNSTSYGKLFELDFKYFLIGLIPFAVYALTYAILYLINPYRKVPAKYAPRIMLLISAIITVQLLLITYCVNLQLGFYSFTQENYNHLLWIIPTIISFAPIVCNLIYMTLFYSKNFNV